MDKIKEAVDTFLNFKKECKEEELIELLSLLQSYTKMVEERLESLKLKKEPSFEIYKAFLNSKISGHSTSLERHCGTNRACNKLMSLDPNMTVLFLIENYSVSSLFGLKGFGRKCINGVREWLWENNFDLGQKIHPVYKTNKEQNR